MANSIYFQIKSSPFFREFSKKKREHTKFLRTLCLFRIYKLWPIMTDLVGDGFLSDVIFAPQKR